MTQNKLLNCQILNQRKTNKILYTHRMTLLPWKFAGEIVHSFSLNYKNHCCFCTFWHISIEAKQHEKLLITQKGTLFFFRKLLVYLTHQSRFIGHSKTRSDGAKYHRQLVGSGVVQALCLGPSWGCREGYPLPSHPTGVTPVHANCPYLIIPTSGKRETFHRRRK